MKKIKKRKSSPRPKKHHKKPSWFLIGISTYLTLLILLSISYAIIVKTNVLGLSTTQILPFPPKATTTSATGPGPVATGKVTPPQPVTGHLEVDFLDKNKNYVTKSPLTGNSALVISNGIGKIVATAYGVLKWGANETPGAYRATIIKLPSVTMYFATCTTPQNCPGIYKQLKYTRTTSASVLVFPKGTSFVYIEFVPKTVSQ